jgi:hypothetical protein
VPRIRCRRGYAKEECEPILSIIGLGPAELQLKKPEVRSASGEEIEPL